MQSSLSSYIRSLHEPVKKYREYTYMYYLYIKALLCKVFFEYLDRFNRKVMPFYIYKIYAYPSDELKNGLTFQTTTLMALLLHPQNLFQESNTVVYGRIKNIR